MTDQKTEQQFIDAVRHRFDQSVDQLDANTLSALNSIRNIAMESGGEKHRYRSLLPVGAMVAAAVAIVVFTLVKPAPSSPFVTEDIEMFSSSEEIEFYENLEFYQWLEEYDISV
jgi:hypothetical protein